MDETEQEQPEAPLPRLAVSRESWHYKYFCFLLGMWGMSPPAKTSLCPYCQSMLWLSVLTLMTAPIYILGWVFLKAARIWYKSFEALGMTTCLSIFDATPFGDGLGKSTEAVKKAPLPALGAAALAVVVGFGLIGGLIIALLWAIVLVIAAIPHMPHALYESAIWVFSWAFWVFARLGQFWIWGYGHVSEWLVWFFTNKPMWEAIGSWSLNILGFGVIAVITTYLLFMLSQSKIGQAIIDYFVFKKNGYTEARTRVKEETDRRRAIQDEVKKPPCRCMRVCTWIGSCIGSLFSKTKVVKGGAVSVLTGLGVFWHLIVAFKRRACPIVEFTGGQHEEKPLEPADDA